MLLAAAGRPVVLLAASRRPGALLAASLRPVVLLAASLRPVVLLAASLRPGVLLAASLRPVVLLAASRRPGALLAASRRPGSTAAGGRSRTRRNHLSISKKKRPSECQVFRLIRQLIVLGHGFWSCRMPMTIRTFEQDFINHLYRVLFSNHFSIFSVFFLR